MAKRGKKEKDNWKKKRRQEYLEQKEFQYYIFCEGQATEPKYFQGFDILKTIRFTVRRTVRGYPGNNQYL